RLAAVPGNQICRVGDTFRDTVSGRTAEPSISGSLAAGADAARGKPGNDAPRFYSVLAVNRTYIYLYLGLCGTVHSPETEGEEAYKWQNVERESTPTGPSLGRPSRLKAIC